ncbi:MAG: hypothetical protein P1U87_01805 [Verrucomicrobiales bacterium]|nr:hypothetical protein [Verrucomicrobiales bacterium]
MDQPSVDSTDSETPPFEGELVPLPYLSADEAVEGREDPFVLVVQNALEFCRWTVAEAPGLQWIQAENLLGEPEVWATAARKGNGVALDVIVSDPATEYSAIYRLVDLRVVRDVRVTIPVLPGFLKALRLAASIQVPVRLLPGTITSGNIAELKEAADYFLHDPSVEVPVEFFHSLFGFARGLNAPDLWIVTESDPDIFESPLASGGPRFVERHMETLDADEAECVKCRWRDFCRGYFKHPDPSFPCDGIKSVFSVIGDAADEMGRDLAGFGDGESPEGV